MNRPTQTAHHFRRPSTLTVSGTMLLCFGLTACGGANTKTDPPNTAQAAGASPSSSADAPTIASTRPRSSAAGNGSACALVTLPEVTTAAGQPMTTSGDAGAICSFSATADPSVLVYVQLYPDIQSMATPKEMESGSSHLSGLGDNAFFAAAGIVFVQKGSRGFSITMPSLNVISLDAPPAIVTLATAALTRL